jgi:hypothetical protein
MHLLRIRRFLVVLLVFLPIYLFFRTRTLFVFCFHLGISAFLNGFLWIEIFLISASMIFSHLTGPYSIAVSVEVGSLLGLGCFPWA